MEMCPGRGAIVKRLSGRVESLSQSLALDLFHWVQYAGSSVLDVKTQCFAILLSRIKRDPWGLINPLKDPHQVHLRGHADILGLRTGTTNKSGREPGANWRGGQDGGIFVPNLSDVSHHHKCLFY